MQEALKEILKEVGITCTPVGVTVVGKNVTLKFTSSDTTQFMPFLANQDEPVILLCIPAQGELAFTETEPDLPGGTTIDVELPLDDEVEFLCPECNAPLVRCGVEDEDGTKMLICERESCEKQGVYVSETELQPESEGVNDSDGGTEDTTDTEGGAEEAGATDGEDAEA